MAGHDGHCIVEPHDLTHTGYGLRLGLVDRQQLAAEGRRGGHHGESHPGQSRVDAELGAAVDLAGAVEAAVRRADQLEVARLLERHLLGHRQFRGGIDELPVAELAAGWGVHDPAVVRMAGGDIDVPAPGGGRHQHDAGRGTGAAQRLIGAADCGRRTRQLSADQWIDVDLVVGRRMLDRDAVDIDLEFLGDQHRNRGVGALAHLDHWHHERDLAGAIDAQECVGRERRVGGEAVAYFGARGQPEADQQPATQRVGHGHLEKVAARRRCDTLRCVAVGGHLTPPRWWSGRTRWRWRCRQLA